mmetsp:Transcript_7627/g.23228  ORF Transcript_7627/g.23228 Transcript_7627/m.23228 type:complete len:343 (-) Transcript_7627:2216-3244(-)
MACPSCSAASPTCCSSRHGCSRAVRGARTQLPRQRRLPRGAEASSWSPRACDPAAPSWGARWLRAGCAACRGYISSRCAAVRCWCAPWGPSSSLPRVTCCTSRGWQRNWARWPPPMASNRCTTSTTTTSRTTPRCTEVVASALPTAVALHPSPATRRARRCPRPPFPAFLATAKNCPARRPASASAVVAASSPASRTTWICTCHSYRARCRRNCVCVRTCWIAYSCALASRCCATACAPPLVAAAVRARANGAQHAAKTTLRSTQPHLPRTRLSRHASLARSMPRATRAVRGVSIAATGTARCRTRTRTVTWRCPRRVTHRRGGVRGIPPRRSRTCRRRGCA